MFIVNTTTHFQLFNLLRWSLVHFACPCPCRTRHHRKQIIGTRFVSQGKSQTRWRRRPPAGRWTGLVPRGCGTWQVRLSAYFTLFRYPTSTNCKLVGRGWRACAKWRNEGKERLPFMHCLLVSNVFIFLPHALTSLCQEKGQNQ